MGKKGDLDITPEMREFSLEWAGKFEKYSETLSKGRVRIFYLGRNRNGSYITPEFAEKLLSTIAFAPVKGIYSDDDDDFTDHGAERSLGRIYGVVPPEHNFAWEEHEDADGVTRTYATVDVLLYTALYAEAGQIITQSKSQSMEIYTESIKGDWKYIDGKRCFVFTDGCFLGLQALGDYTEPCFEGSAFYSLMSEYSKLANEIKELKSQLEGGNSKVENNALFKISDDQKYNMIFNLLNCNVDADGYRIYEYGICSVYDDYAVAFSFADGSYERVYYTKNDATDSLEINEKKKCFIIDVDEVEMAAINALHAISDNFTALNDKFAEMSSEIENYSQTKSELEATISTLNTEKENLTTEFTAKENELNELNDKFTAQTEELNAVTADRDELSAFKANVLTANKQAVIDSYKGLVADEIIADFTARIEDYADETAIDKDLAYELKKNNMQIFTKSQAQPLVPNTNNDEPTGIEAVLAKYKK